MTEYDYSPEGYERYLETRNRTANWVDGTERHRNEYKAPFGARSDVDDSEQWDGVVRRSTSGRSSRGPQYPPPSSYPGPMIAPRPINPSQSWPQQMPPPNTFSPPPPPIIISKQSSKHHKSSKSHKSSRSKSSRAYVITTPPPAAPPHAPSNFSMPHSYAPQIIQPKASTATYMTTDSAGYPVTYTAPLHQIPGSPYSYSTPPAAAISVGKPQPIPYAAPSPVYTTPSPLVSPAGSPYPTTTSLYRVPRPSGSLVIISPNQPPVKVIY